MEKKNRAKSRPSSLAKAVEKAGAGLQPARSIQTQDDGSVTLDYSLSKVHVTLGGVELDAVEMVERHILSENARAWLRIVDVLDLALLNPGITNNRHAAEFCSIVRQLAVSAREDFTVDQVLAPLKTAAKSIHAGDVASKKNARPRAWVLQEWVSRSDSSQSKASFGRQYAALVKNKFGVSVTPETITRDWLSKSSE